MNELLVPGLITAVILAALAGVEVVLGLNRR